MLQFKCLHLATGATWYVSCRLINEDLGAPLFADHIRALTESFDSNLADVGNPLAWQLGRYVRCSWVYLIPLREKKARQGPVGKPKPSPPAMAKSTK